MRPTTSPPTLSRLWTASLSLLALAGCAPETGPEAVQVTVSGPSSSVDAPPPAVSLDGVAGLAAALPGEPGRNVFLGSALGRAESALAEVLVKREAALVRARNDMVEAAVAAEQAETRAQLLRLGDERETVSLAALGSLRARFKDHADLVGPLWAELAWRAGLPDPDPESKREPDPRVFGDQADVARSRELRREIGTLDAEFRSAVVEAWESVETWRRTRETALMAEAALREDAARARAEEEAARLSLTARAGLLGSDLDEFVRLEAVEPVAATLPAVSPRAPAWPESPATAWSPTDRAARQAQVFASVQGKRLDPKGRDLSPEFRVWRAWLWPGL
jgi:hypothetical protein